VEANSTGSQGSRRAVEPSDDDDDIQMQSFSVRPTDSSPDGLTAADNFIKC
jgi:hypothetical protein